MAQALKPTLLLTLTLCALSTPPAQSATYTQHACRLPDGTPTIADGFRSSISDANATYTNSCVSSGVLEARVARGAPGSTEAAIKYYPAPDTEIVGVRVERDTADLGSPGQAQYSFAGTADSCKPAACPSGIAGGVYTFVGSLGTLDFAVQCVADGCAAPGPFPRINVRRVEIDLNDAANPTFSAAPSGGLFDTSRSLRGVEAVSFRAEDAGSGVASVAVVVDGVERERRSLDDGSQTCVAPYTRRVPCPLSVAPSFGFDTAQLADGRHEVSLVLRDATGVNTGSYGPVGVTVANRAESAQGDAGANGGAGASDGPGAPGATGALGGLTAVPNGINASRKARFAGGATASRTIRHGSSTLIRGRLVDETGAAIAHARIDVLAKVRRPRKRAQAVGHVTTSSTGSWSYRVKPGASRDVTFAYRATSGDPAYAATQRHTVLVRAGVTLKRSTRSLRNGGVLKLTARVLGPEVTKRSAAIAFQVKIGSRWRTFGVTSIDTKGRARIKHRFRYTTHTVTYAFRATTVRSTTLPYVTGTSPSRKVKVRP